MSYAQRGQRTLPEALDYHVANTPERILASVALCDEDVSKGFHDVTMQEFGHAVDALAHWLANTFGTSDVFETLSYIGVNDLRYPMFLIAAIKCGYKTLLINTRNSVEQNMSLLKQMKVRRVFYAPEMHHVASELDGMDITPIAPWETWSQAFTEAYPFTKSFEDCKEDPIVVLHSSGSTGSPKPIVHTHAYYAAQETTVPHLSGREYNIMPHLLTADSYRFISTWALPHLSGTFCGTLITLFSKNTSLFMPPTNQPATAEVIKQMMRMKKTDMVFLPPNVVEDMVQDTEFVDMLKQSGVTIAYSGGPLTPAVGDRLTEEGVKLINFWGQTEFGVPPALRPNDPKNWAWFEFHPCLEFDFEPAADGKYELVLNRKPAEKYHPAFKIVSEEVQQIRSKDLFTPHPTEPGLWQFYARTDDVIVLNSGRKWFPLLSEGRLMAHPKVQGAMYLGDRRPFVVALIEAKDGLTIDELWPIVEETNSRDKDVGCLTKSRIAILPEGSFVRSPKGTVIRKQTLAANVNVIEALYAVN